MTMKTFEDLPTFDNLPDKRRYWEWGEAGSYEEGLGKLNLLTDQHVARAAAQEIKTGERVGLGWDLDKLDVPAFGRKKYDHKIQWLFKPWAFDDEYHFNPQQGSQWDGFRHHSQPKDASSSEHGYEHGSNGDPDETAVWYGGTKSTEILDRKNDRIGIQHWARKGIVGRGVLLDYAEYAKERGIEYSTLSDHVVRLEDLKNIIKEKNIEIQKGDILFVRIGLVKEWEGQTQQWREDHELRTTPYHTGVEQSEDVLRFLWDNHFTAVAGDAIGWEVTPPQHPTLFLHHYLLAGWGVPIGELFNLEELASTCKRLNRYSFFVSSAPFPAMGGVSSPPNALAIF